MKLMHNFFLSINNRALQIKKPYFNSELTEEKQEQKQEEQQRTQRELQQQVEFFKRHLKLQKKPELPKLYTKRAIYVFSFLCSTIFGGVMLAMNLKRLDNRKAIFPVMLFSIVFPFFLGALIRMLTAKGFDSVPLVFLLNVIGAVIISEPLWNSFIGKDTTYKKRAVWKPTLIALLLVLVYVLLMIASGVVTF